MVGEQVEGGIRGRQAFGASAGVRGHRFRSGGRATCGRRHGEAVSHGQEQEGVGARGTAHNSLTWWRTGSYVRKGLGGVPEGRGRRCG